MNKVILMGRLTRDPEVRYSQGQTPMAVAKYTLAVDRRFVKRDDPNAQTADFISCTAFGKTGEFAERYLKKGMKIAITGRIQTGSYTNKDGQKVYTTDVVIDEQEFAESKNAQGGGSGNLPNFQGGNIPDNASALAGTPEQGAEVTPDFMNIPGVSDDGELPFV